MIKKVIYVCIVFFLISCISVQYDNVVPHNLSKINFANKNDNNSFTRLLVNKLQQNGFELIDDSNSPLLTIESISNNSSVVSLFESGIKAEDEILVEITANVQFPTKKTSPINVKLVRTFFDNPKAALAKDQEKTDLIEQINDQAAENFIVKLISILTNANTQKNR